jgi:hypothetical protein
VHNSRFFEEDYVFDMPLLFPHLPTLQKEAAVKNLTAIITSEVSTLQFLIHNLP